MKEEKGFATVFSIFMSMLLFSLCSAFVIVASVLGIKHTANHAAEEAALVLAGTLDCVKAQELAESNNAELVICNLESDFVNKIFYSSQCRNSQDNYCYTNNYLHKIISSTYR